MVATKNDSKLIFWDTFLVINLQRWSRLQGSSEKGPGPVAGGLVVEPPSVVSTSLVKGNACVRRGKRYLLRNLLQLPGSLLVLVLVFCKETDQF